MRNGRGEDGRIEVTPSSPSRLLPRQFPKESSGPFRLLGAAKDNGLVKGRGTVPTKSLAGRESRCSERLLVLLGGEKPDFYDSFTSLTTQPADKDTSAVEGK